MTAAEYRQVWDDGNGRRIVVYKAPKPGPAGIYPNGSRVAVENVITGRKSTILVDSRGMIRRYFRVGVCDMCHEAAPKPGVCCSSHSKVLCCRCYRLSHFQEMGCTCCPDGREIRARHGLSDDNEAATG